MYNFLILIPIPSSKVFHDVLYPSYDYCKIVQFSGNSFKFVSSFIYMCNWFQEVGTLTAVQNLYPNILDSLKTDRRGKGWSTEDVLNINADILYLKKSVIEIFHETSANYLYALKFRLLNHFVEDLKIYWTLFHWMLPFLTLQYQYQCIVRRKMQAKKDQNGWSCEKEVSTHYPTSIRFRRRTCHLLIRKINV